MGDSARKREKQRLKRKQKQLQARKAKSISPVRRVAADSLECWINENWRPSGMASIIVLGAAPAGMYIAGNFLVDIWCVGLKDAFVRVDVSRADLLEKMESGGLVSIDVATARRLVAGGIRYSRQNGFRLPPHYERAIAVLGPLGDLASADLSDFKPQSEMLYTGDIEFLRTHYLRGTPEDFLARRDIHFSMNFDGRDQYLIDADQDEDRAQDEEEFDEEEELGAFRDMDAEITSTMTTLKLQYLKSVLDWSSENGKAAHPRVAEACDMLAMATTFGVAKYGSVNLTPDQVRELVALQIRTMGPEDPIDLQFAIDQSINVLAKVRQKRLESGELKPEQMAGWDSVSS